MKIDSFFCGDLMVNCYVLSQEGRDDCIVIDPGEVWPVLDYLNEFQKKPAAILLTHGHFDHIGGAKQLREETGALICIHTMDADKLQSNRKNLSVLTGQLLEPFEADRLLEDGEVLDYAGITLEVIHTPGHSVGGVCFVAKEERAIFCGDTVFYESCGRTDFPDGNQLDLYHSIADKLFTLEGDYTLYPGHDMKTTLEHERKYNMLYTTGKRLQW